MKKALIFDMDGVVVNNDRYHYLAWKEFAEKHGKKLSFEEVKSWFGSTNISILIDFFDRELSPDDIKKYSAEKEKIYRDIYSPHIKPIKGLKGLLEAASGDGFVIGLATSAPPENVEFVLERTKLRKYFTEITDDSQISRGKPDPEIFITTAGKLGIDPSRSIVFEDSFYGIEAGKKAGMKVVAVASTHQPDKLKHADRVIINFSEIDLEELDILMDE
ncbi:MAG: HAD family hydrolase [Bacteroidota bacterium]